MHPSAEQTYALRLRSEPLAGQAVDPLAGEIEHVLSGERRTFADGAQLLEQLAQLRRLAARAAACDLRR